MPYHLKRWLLSRDWANDFSIPYVWLLFLFVVSHSIWIYSRAHGRARALRITIVNIESFVLLGSIGNDDDGDKSSNGGCGLTIPVHYICKFVIGLPVPKLSEWVIFLSQKFSVDWTVTHGWLTWSGGTWQPYAPFWCTTF